MNWCASWRKGGLEGHEAERGNRIVENAHCGAALLASGLWAQGAGAGDCQGRFRLSRGELPNGEVQG